MLSKRQTGLGLEALLVVARGVGKEHLRVTAELSGRADVPGRRCRPF